tara:strand:+ start:279 stop:647 length:369 start_codon:yes stop_codon:yes gene_type:complete
MIKMTVDEAYAFDYYSILQIKFENDTIQHDTVEIIRHDIISQIGEVFHEVLRSKEYANLLKANKETFEAVDKAKIDDVLASFVDKCNYKRMLAKKALQERFFSSPLSETKIGYEKYNLKETT